MKQLIILAAFLANTTGFASKPAVVPDHVTFDYQITQQSHDNQSGNTETITYYFTKDGSYR